jgi:hypothetical protein
MDLYQSFPLAHTLWIPVVYLPRLVACSLHCQHQQQHLYLNKSFYTKKLGTAFKDFTMGKEAEYLLLLGLLCEVIEEDKGSPGEEKSRSLRAEGLQ